MYSYIILTSTLMTYAADSVLEHARMVLDAGNIGMNKIDKSSCT